MRKIFLFIATFIQFGSVYAQQIELICRGQGWAGDMVPLKINFQKNSAVWGTDEDWKIVNQNEKYITIRRNEHHYSLGGMIWVIERFSGEFVQTYVGMMTKKGDGTDSRLDGYVLKGVCNLKKF